jgi:bifunctional UDP-N-acetylglucosamine pyrophosphorylase / glucosamine-1-phosphate N-acetyltransferase
MKLEVVILAAGQGTRMRSELPKVLHPVAGRPMLAHVLDIARSLAPRSIHVVVGHGAEQVRAALPEAEVSWVLQEQQLGTGHAVLQALPGIAADATVLVLYGDVPLIRLDSLQALVAQAGEGPALLTAEVADPTGYGRILRDTEGALVGVVEEKDASDTQRAIREINTGVLAAPAALLADYLPRVGNANRQGEYYLPDVAALAVADGVRVHSSRAPTEVEILGVNDRLQLAVIEREYQSRQAQALLLAGVSIADPARIDVRGELRCGANVRIDVNAVFEGLVVLGDNASIGPNCVLIDSTVGDGATVHAMSHLEGAVVGPDCQIGPFARLRPGSALDAGARIGNFVETKKATIGRGSKVNHLSYIGDCVMGAGVNVGAGTITCNYDGVSKHRTDIGDGAFVGSNSTLVAPLEIGPGGYIGAGSTVTKAVGEDELAISRGRQRNIQGWNRPQKQES